MQEEPCHWLDRIVIPLQLVKPLKRTLFDRNRILGHDNAALIKQISLFNTANSHEKYQFFSEETKFI